GIAGFPWGAVLGVRSAAWLLQASDEQRRNAPQGKPALRVVPQCSSRVVALLAKAISISCVATPSGELHWGTTIPYIKTKSALDKIAGLPWIKARQPIGSRANGARTKN